MALHHQQPHGDYAAASADQEALFTFFLPTYGISRPCALKMVKQIWGPKASARPFQYRKIEGLLLESPVTPTKCQLEDLKAASWQFEMDAAKRRVTQDDEDIYVNQPILLSRRQ